MENNFYSGAYTRDFIWNRYAANLDGPICSLFLVLAQRDLSEKARNALESSAQRLGWQKGATFLFVDSKEELSGTTVFEAIEGLDPLCLILAGAKACDLASQAYGVDIPHVGLMRLFGRSTCALADLETLLASDAGKQKVWASLKLLPSPTY